MQISVRGEMTMAEIRQALYEKLHELEDDYSVRYSRGATLFINPTNGFGDDIEPRNRHGRSVEKIYSTGPYHSAADDYLL